MRIVNLSNLPQFTAVNLSSDPGAVTGPVVIPNTAQIVLYWNLIDGKIGHNVLYGRYSGAFAGSQAQCNSILTGLSSGAQWTAMAAFLATATALNGVSIQDVNTASQAKFVSSVGGGNGTSASTAMPSEVALALTLRTAFVGRQFRGRLFIPGWATNAIGASDTVAASAVTAATNWGGTITSVFAGQGYTFSLGQRARVDYTSPGGVHHPARAANSIPISQAVCRDNHWDSQRRRGLR